jgi:2-(1,2-epoxy-1,2-dihydrophenyl)acetyl-CoA isomerase
MPSLVEVLDRSTRRTPDRVAVQFGSSSFAQVFSRIGLSPDLGGSWILPRLVGLQQARQLALLGDDVSGRRAAQIGLIMGCVPVDALDTTVNDLARRLASNSAAAQARTKHLLDDALAGSLAEALGREAAAQVANVATPHFHQALTNFRNSHLGDPA